MFDDIVPVFSTTYMSEGGHPAVMYETTTCCSTGQLRVKPMSRGVGCRTWFLGGAFHDGTGGIFENELSKAASGKVSTTGGSGSGTGLGTRGEGEAAGGSGALKSDPFLT